MLKPLVQWTAKNPFKEERKALNLLFPHESATRFLLLVLAFVELESLKMKMEEQR